MTAPDRSKINPTSPLHRRGRPQMTALSANMRLPSQEFAASPSGEAPVAIHNCGVRLAAQKLAAEARIQLAPKVFFR